MWSLLFLVPILSASPQLKYVESAVHFKGEADNNSFNKTATVNNQEKAAALNTVYQSPAELSNYHADQEPANVDHQVEEDCCCSASLETNHPGLRIVNRPPKTNDHHQHHYHHHQHQEHHQQDQKPKTCQPLACCKRKSQQVFHLHKKVLLLT